MNVRKKSLIILLIMVFFIFMGSASAASTTKKVNATDQRFNTVSIPFVENHGQISDKNVKYSANTFLGNVYIKDNGITYVLTKDKKSWIVSESFLNSNSVTATGKNPTKTKVNYYKGKTSQKNLATYKTVQYTNLYTGVNLSLEAYGKNIQKIYTIGSTGNPKSIWVAVNGSKGLKINKKGELEILNNLGTLKLTKPIAYQMINSKRVNVSVSYLLNGSSYGYKTGAYNKKYKLIIDPLLSSTYLGGNSYDGANAIAVDKSGNVYVTGYTGSYDFPAYTGLYNNGAPTAEWDVFVSKFSSDLSSLKESTFIGGTFSDQAKAIALDNLGNLFITGVTYSTGVNTYNDYPTGNSPGLKMSWDTGAGDVFISKLNCADLTLKTSTIIGGNRSDVANGILVDASNNVYITGQTFSFNGTDPSGHSVTGYPVRYSAFGEPTMENTYQGIGDVFVSKLNNGLSEFTSGVVFGGSGTSYANAIAIDQQNYIYITGASNATDFPEIELKNTYPDNRLLNNKGKYDAFVVKLSSQYLENIEGVALLGGSEVDVGNGIAVDPVGRVYVVGGTWSQNFSPIVSQQQSTNRGPPGTEDGFVTILDKQLQNVLYSIYLGGNGNDVANGVVVPGLGPNFGVVGTTNSTNFSGVTQDTPYFGNEDVFFSVLKNPSTIPPTNTNPQTLDTSIIGGANADYGTSAAITGSGNVYIAGNTWSNDYPTTIGAYDNFAHNDGGYSEDAYVSKIGNFVDTEPPIITKTDPANNADKVALNKAINVVYNEPILGSNLSGITLSTINGPVAIKYPSLTGNSLVIVPLTNYIRGATYTLNIPIGAVKDLAGNIAKAYTTSFTTIPPIQVTSTDPINNAVNVALNKAINVVYTDPIQAGSNFSGITLSTINGPIAIKSMTTTANSLIIVPLTNYIGGTTYTLFLPNDAIEDLAGNVANAYTTSFTTVPPLQVTSTDPVNNAVSIPVNKVIKITFNRPIHSGSNYNLITLKNSSNTSIPITTYIYGNVLTIIKSSGTFAGDTYTLTLPVNSVLDVNNTSLITGYTLKFTVDSVPTKITKTDPANNALKVATNKAIIVTFSKPIYSLNTSAIVIKSSTGTKIPISFSISSDGKTLTIKHSTLFAKGTKYTVTFPAKSVLDRNNNYMVPYSFSFTTTT